MKNVALLVVFTLFCANAFSQTMEQVMDKRAREMHRVLGLADKEQWKKFIQENYSKTLIEKPMKSTRKTQQDESTSSESKEIKGTVEDKVNMFQRLHDDLLGSKIVSIKPVAENLEMVVENSELTGTIKLKFDKNKPHLIEGMGLQLEGGR